MKQPMTDPLKPDLSLLSKLGSIVVHTDEALSVAGHTFDIEAIRPLLGDPSVRQWIADMGVYLPLKRSRP